MYRRELTQQAITYTLTHILHIMLAYKQSGRILKSVALISRAQTRLYSAHGHDAHGEEHHGEHGHDEHGHDDHGLQLSEAESILNKKTAIAAGIVTLAVGYYTINSSYEKSHEGASLLSIIKKPEVLSELQANYNEYRARVAKQEEIQAMIVFPSVEKRSYNNMITSIDEVPGRYFASGSNTQFNTIQDHSSLAPRKTKESPFY